jgi:hypothetical protein
MALITLRLELPAHFLDVRGQRAGFVLLAAFLGSFLFIRTSARLMRSPKVPWWPGSVTTGSGLHLHHLVWGIVLVLLAGFLEFATTPTSPWNEILASTSGVGSGLPCLCALARCRWPAKELKSARVCTRAYRSHLRS